ncbi:dihydroorotate oxidase B electron transfer subunit [Tumebacillus permanentifrigoris]|uniref:Dihydroorotate dehydrogenase B (NAD(+)), electron transfer subunit n=2 Tax=Tumebacillus permanentifrigoris TaxID=378543 RepID=A0A316D8X2_9BACL|nr:dihydroorotate dehydrogenase electron transfer subunit [Tumebacillus permanentifrigoris]PWK12860.1 dihydroorotate oxidase B electron transfer subunit [Tumebacillus permanentifrigoris]
MARLTILEHREIADNMRWLAFEAPHDLQYEPGQFLHIRVTDGVDHLLRRPISLCRVDGGRNALVVAYRVGGKGTKLLAAKNVGDTLDVLGPLGKGFPLHDEDRHAILVGGGIGVPPMVELADQLTQRGVQVTTIVGFQSKNVSILIDELTRYGEVLVATNDGSLGLQGFVTDYMTDELLASADRFYACGPTPMLRAVQARMTGRVEGYLSLEERMGCGIGACMACVTSCVLPDGSVGFKKVCKDGPVFPAPEVYFA